MNGKGNRVAKRINFLSCFKKIFHLPQIYFLTHPTGDRPNSFVKTKNRSDNQQPGLAKGGEIERRSALLPKRHPKTILSSPPLLLWAAAVAFEEG
jgi:hypothetical protein